MKVFHSLRNPALARLLEAGAIGIMPTDTVYGIVARAADPRAVAHLYRAKHREGKPGTVIAANVEQLRELGVAAKHLKKVARWWPNALSIVVPAPKKLAYLDQGKASLAVRVPEHPAIHELLLQTGPLLTSSANQPGEPTAISYPEARHYFGDIVDFYVDGGRQKEPVPSTLIRLSEQGDIEVLRRGAVQLDL